jgi:hypothetical protein
MKFGEKKRRRLPAQGGDARSDTTEHHVIQLEGKERKQLSFPTFYARICQFTQTGSGQTQGRHSKKEAVFLAHGLPGVLIPD